MSERFIPVRFLLLLALALAVPLAAPVAAQGDAGPWPQEAADAESSRQARSAGPADPGLRWHADLPAVQTSLAPEGYHQMYRRPILSPDGHVLVVITPDTTPSQQRTAVLVALDRDTGEVRWELDDVSGRCGPVVDSQGRIWVIRIDGDDPALEAVGADGSVIAGSRLDDVLVCGGEDHVTSIGDDRLVLVAGRAGADALALYDLSGPAAVESWRAQEGEGFGRVLYGPANLGLGIPHPLVTDDAVLLLTESDDGDAVELVAFDAADGSVDDRLELRLPVVEGPDEQVPDDLREWHPTVIGDTVVFVVRERARPGRDYQPRGFLAAIDLTTGLDQLAWQVPMDVEGEFDAGAQLLTRGAGVVIARPDSDSRLVGYDPQDGSIAWVGDPLGFGSAGFVSHVADADGATYASAPQDGTTQRAAARFGPTGALDWAVGIDVLNATIDAGDRPVTGNLWYGPVDDGVLYLVDDRRGTPRVIAIDSSGGLAEARPPLPGEPGVSRVDGAGTGQPVATAIEICQFLVDDGAASSIALARDDDFADALAGSALPVDCILFTDGGLDAQLNPETRTEIQRALGDQGTVYVLGGIHAVSAATADAVQGDGYQVDRLEGPTRFETAESVATQVGVLLGAASPDQVIVAFGGDWADAVTVGAYAHATTTPIVLTPTDTLHPAADRIISAAGPAVEVVLVGGDAVVGPAVEQAVPNPRRVAGINRMATAVAIAQDLWPAVPASGTAFVLANLERAEAWTIALASAPLAAQLQGPQLGLRVDSYPTETRAYLEGLGLTDLPSVVLLGDLGFIDNEVAESVDESVTPD